MTELEQLRHRLKMIEDDMKVVRAFVYKENLSKDFEKPARNINAHINAKCIYVASST